MASASAMTATTVTSAAARINVGAPGCNAEKNAGARRMNHSISAPALAGQGLNRWICSDDSLETNQSRGRDSVLLQAGLHGGLRVRRLREDRAARPQLAWRIRKAATPGFAGSELSGQCVSGADSPESRRAGYSCASPLRDGCSGGMGRVLVSGKLMHKLRALKVERGRSAAARNDERGFLHGRLGALTCGPEAKA